MIEILYTLVLTHITILSVTLYLHRSQTHRAVEFHPVIAHFMRFWLWLTTGMITREWVAVHRRHHQYADAPGDPHSPSLFGIKAVLFTGASLYYQAAQDQDMVAVYGRGTPDDWVERNIYQDFNYLGVLLMLLIDVLLFDWLGFAIWAVQMIWIPFWAAGVINGLAHWIGYRNTNTRDNSRNLTRIAFFIGGEELHNNHHAAPGSAKFAVKDNEFDWGWRVIELLERCRLAELSETHKNSGNP